MTNKEKNYKWLAGLLISACIGLVIGTMNSFYKLTMEFPVDTTSVIHVVKEPPLPDSTIKMIEKKAQARGFNIKTALRIAECESQLGKFKKNWEGSSATGIYMFMPNTFKSFCTGDINSDEDQTDCFMNLYPKYAGMWVCK